MEGIKRCNSCLQAKSLSEFHSCGNGKTRGKCRSCYNDESRDRYKSDVLFNVRVRDKAKRWKNRNRSKYLENQRKASKKYWDRLSEEEKKAKSLRYSQHLKDLKNTIPGYRTAFNGWKTAKQLGCVPKWAKLKELLPVYAAAASVNDTVGYVVPLKGENVCGLHVLENLCRVEKRSRSRSQNKAEVKGHEKTAKSDF